MASYSVNGLVIHRVNTGETDRILTLFTREKGKLSAIAKSSRSAKSRSSGATELFTASKYLLGEGKSLDVVSQIEIKSSYCRLGHVRFCVELGTTAGECVITHPLP